MKRSRKILFILFSLILFFLISFSFLKFFIVKNINNSINWAVKDIDFSLKSINLEDLTYKDTWVSVKLENLKIKPKIIKNAFAFEGPGEFLTDFEKKKLTVEGKIKGNVASGNMNIAVSHIKIENVGNLKFHGELQNWGKEKFEGILQLDGLKIKEISGMTKYKIQFDGKVYGNIFIEKEKENLKEIKFDIEIKDLKHEYEETIFTLILKGKYIPFEKKGIIEKGELINEKGERLSFNGYIEEKEFEFYFDTQEFSIYEFLKLLPEEIRKKYNLKFENSKISLKSFSLNFSKKKFILMANFSFNPII
ncbi:MAG: hypothetical protein ACP5OB_05390 [Candidatus Ratteibacteria bacterium]